MHKSQQSEQPNFYIRSKIAHEPVITFSEEELYSKSPSELNRIKNYHLLTLKLLVGDQIINILNNLNHIETILNIEKKSNGKTKSI